MRRLNTHTTTVSGRKGKDLRSKGQRCRQAGVPEESVRNGYPDNAPVQFGTGYSTSHSIHVLRMDLVTNSNYIPTQHWPFLQPRYSVYCAVRTGYLEKISSQFTAESVFRPPYEFCGAESSNGTVFCPSSLLRVFSCQYHSAQARYLSSSTQEETKNPGNFRKQCNFANRTALHKKNTFTPSLYASYFQSNVGKRKTDSIIILISQLVS